MHIYILRVHVLGFVLWGTVIAIDFTHPCLVLFFTTGLFGGLVLSKLSRISVRREHHPCFIMVYCVLNTLILVICFMFSEIVYDNFGLFAFFMVTFPTGVLWGVQDPDSKIIFTCHNAFITTTLMSVPMLFLQMTTDNAQEYILKSVSVNTYVMIFEPLMKFLQIYIIIVSAQTNKILELCIILSSNGCDGKPSNFASHFIVYNTHVLLPVCFMLCIYTRQAVEIRMRICSLRS